MRTVLAAVLLALLLAAPADARRLEPVGKLRATALPGTIELTWKDRARGETRYVVRRRGTGGSAARRAGRRTRRLRAGRTGWTDRKVAPGVRYRYTVRPCRRGRCAKPRAVRVTAAAGAQPAPSQGGPGAPAPAPGSSPLVGGCPMFPADNAWNADISQATVLDDYTDTFPAAMTLWPDFGGAGEYGIPYVTVPASQPGVPVAFEVADESEPGPYPIPLDAPVENGGDRHVLVVREGECKLYELYAAERSGAGWSAYSGAIFDLRSNALRPAGWTSADAAGLPILAGLARRDEVAAGAIRHALRVTVPRTSDAYIHPATHAAASGTGADPPMGLRLRLRADYPIAGFGPQARAVAQALKTYGALVADNSGGNPNRIYVSGARDLGWDDDDLAALKSIPASALQAVRTGPVIPAH
jgi:hypothetical protein